MATAARQHFIRIAWGSRDRQAVMLASWGFSNAFIEEKTGLSPGQIGYRMKQLGMRTSRRDYRNGNGEAATLLLRGFSNDIMPTIANSTVA